MILNLFFSKFFSFSDAPEAWGMNFQDPGTPIAEGMIYFHSYLMLFLLVTGVFVFWMLVETVRLFTSETSPISESFTHSSVLEFVWTILPGLVLLTLATPSFALLYSLDESIDPSLTVQVIGHQWYWSYYIADFLEYDNAEPVYFESYMVDTPDLVKGTFRLLEVDNRLVLPTETHIRFLVSSADVIHSWAVPGLGTKTDACPGRLTQASFYIKREGTFYGQCSEICGVNHGFMPVVVQTVSKDAFLDYYSANK